MTSDWIRGRVFAPATGKSYEVTFGKIAYRGQTGHVNARLRIDGPQQRQWIDLDNGLPLDPELGKYVVQAFREI